jgi:hypothetical protein
MSKSYVKLTIKEYNDLVVNQSEKYEIDKLKEAILRLDEILYSVGKSIKELHEQIKAEKS